MLLLNYGEVLEKEYKSVGNKINHPIREAINEFYKNKLDIANGNYKNLSNIRN